MFRIGTRMKMRRNRKKIYNPVTGRYYEVKRGTTKKHVKGLWKPLKKKRKKSIWDLL